MSTKEIAAGIGTAALAYFTGGGSLAAEGAAEAGVAGAAGAAGAGAAGAAGAGAAGTSAAEYAAMEQAAMSGAPEFGGSALGNSGALLGAPEGGYGAGMGQGFTATGQPAGTTSAGEFAQIDQLAMNGAPEYGGSAVPKTGLLGNMSGKEAMQGAQMAKGLLGGQQQQPQAPGRQPPPQQPTQDNTALLAHYNPELAAYLKRRGTLGIYG